MELFFYSENIINGGTKIALKFTLNAEPILTIQNFIGLKRTRDNIFYIGNSMFDEEI